MFVTALDKVARTLKQLCRLFSGTVPRHRLAERYALFVPKQYLSIYLSELSARGTLKPRGGGVQRGGTKKNWVSMAVRNVPLVSAPCILSPSCLFPSVTKVLERARR